MLQRKQQQARETADRDAKAMVDGGALTGAVNWYRAMPLSDVRRSHRKVTVPTMFVWNERDDYVVEKSARNCGRYVRGEYRFETIPGSHWLLDEQPDAVADLLLEWFATHRV